MLKRLQRERGVSIVYTSHNMREVEILCDRVLFISRGRSVAEGSPAEVIERANGASLEDIFIAIARDGELRDTAASRE
jgi:ABC-2 type transport system ATP-binding protein